MCMDLDDGVTWWFAPDPWYPDDYEQHEDAEDRYAKVTPHKGLIAFRGNRAPAPSYTSYRIPSLTPRRSYHGIITYPRYARPPNRRV